MDGEIPSISIYYEDKQLGWMKLGQKKGNCIFKAYDKETKESVLEINGREYRLKEGIRYTSEPDFEDEEIKAYAKKVGETLVLTVHSKNINKIIKEGKILKIAGKFIKTYGTYKDVMIYVHGTSQLEIERFEFSPEQGTFEIRDIPKKGEEPITNGFVYPAGILPVSIMRE